MCYDNVNLPPAVGPRILSGASAPGSCFVPFLFREAAANVLTIDELDPYGKIPEFKFCAIAVERAAEGA